MSQGLIFFFNVLGLQFGAILGSQQNEGKVQKFPIYSLPPDTHLPVFNISHHSSTFVNN